ncbi:sodium/calcium exchanger NCL2-like protein [Tanacetum coccineum]|uniref:fructose-bisphosphate aldolase n=1 Tax=Tanacetum coccineum TaxID=301880 RepID=A0ABQ5B7W2_9ASTR
MLLCDIEVENDGEAPRIHSMNEHFMSEVGKSFSFATIDQQFYVYVGSCERVDPETCENAMIKLFPDQQFYVYVGSCERVDPETCENAMIKLFPGRCEHDHESSIIKIFNSIDRNNDSSISPTELKDYIIHQYDLDIHDIADDLVDIRMELLDADANGKTDKYQKTEAKARKNERFKAIALLLLAISMLTVRVEPLTQSVRIFSENVKIVSFYVSFILVTLATNAKTTIAPIKASQDKKHPIYHKVLPRAEKKLFHENVGDDTMGKSPSLEDLSSYKNSQSAGSWWQNTRTVGMQHLSSVNQPNELKAHCKVRPEVEVTKGVNLKSWLRTIRALPKYRANTVPSMCSFMHDQKRKRPHSPNAQQHRRQEFKKPWLLSFAYGRALQQRAFEVWSANEEENSKMAQDVFLAKSKANSEATHGEAAYLCGREPNFDLTIEEKEELSRDDFLIMTRSTINSKSVSEILGFPSISHVFVSGLKWAPCLARVRSNHVLADVSSLPRMFLGPRKAQRPGKPIIRHQRVSLFASQFLLNCHEGN